MKINFIQSLKIIILGLILSVGIGFLHAAWINPGVTPPTSDTPVPINASTSPQQKSAGLSLDKLAVLGDSVVTGDLTVGSTPALDVDVSSNKVGIGTTAPIDNVVLDVEGAGKSSSLALGQLWALCIASDGEIIPCSSPEPPLPWLSQMYTLSTSTGDCGNCSATEFIVPSGVSTIVVEAWGAGGGGGGGAGEGISFGIPSSADGSGGGGGGYSRVNLSGVSGAYQVVVGAGGAGGAGGPGFRISMNDDSNLVASIGEIKLAVESSIDLGDGTRFYPGGPGSHGLRGGNTQFKDPSGGILLDMSGGKGGKGGGWETGPDGAGGFGNISNGNDGFGQTGGAALVIGQSPDGSGDNSGGVGAGGNGGDDGCCLGGAGNVGAVGDGGSSGSDAKVIVWWQGSSDVGPSGPSGGSSGL